MIIEIKANGVRRWRIKIACPLRHVVRTRVPVYFFGGAGSIPRPVYRAYKVLGL